MSVPVRKMIVISGVGVILITLLAVFSLWRPDRRIVLLTLLEYIRSTRAAFIRLLYFSTIERRIG